MAELVLGLATSHSPHLSTLPELWSARGERDRGQRELIGTDGFVSDYDGLLARVDTARIAPELTAEKFAERHARNQQGIANIKKTLEEAKLDVCAKGYV